MTTWIIDAATNKQDTLVLVLGMGPAGMAAALMAAKGGYEVDLIGAGHAPTLLPRARRLNMRSLEFLLELGVSPSLGEADALAAWPDVRLTSATGTGDDFQLRGSSRGDAPAKTSVVCNQAIVEEFLRDACLNQPGITARVARYSASTEGDGFKVVSDDSLTEIRQPGVVFVAEGRKSLVRSLLGIAQETLWSAQQPMHTIAWEGALLPSSWPAAQSYFVGRGSQAVSVLPLDTSRSRWAVNVSGNAGESPLDTFQAALAAWTLSPRGTVNELRTWQPAAALATELALLPHVAFIGDTAHVYPPAGGLGLNEAFGDVAFLQEAIHDRGNLAAGLGVYASGRKQVISSGMQRLLVYLSSTKYPNSTGSREAHDGSF